MEVGGRDDYWGYEVFIILIDVGGVYIIMFVGGTSYRYYFSIEDCVLLHEDRVVGGWELSTLLIMGQFELMHDGDTE